MATKNNILTEAGARAAAWVFDTGDCLFCAYEGKAHEGHCVFRGCSDGDLRALVETAATKETR